MILRSKLMDILGILSCGNIISTDRKGGQPSCNPSTDNPKLMVDPKPKVGLKERAGPRGKVDQREMADPKPKVGSKVMAGLRGKAG